MIKNVEYVANTRTLIKVKTDKENLCIFYKDIKPYWDYATPSAFEGGKAMIHGDYLIFTVLTACGQGGVVCIWDCNANKLIHISEGSFVITATIANNKVYKLHDVSCWGVASHLNVSTSPLETMNAWDEGTYLYADTPTEIEDYNNAVNNAKLIVDNEKISIQFKDKNVLFTADESKSTVMNEKFSKYYGSPDETEEESEIRKGKLIAGMLL